MGLKTSFLFMCGHSIDDEWYLTQFLIIPYKRSCLKYPAELHAYRNVFCARLPVSVSIRMKHKHHVIYSNSHYTNLTIENVPQMRRALVSLGPEEVWKTNVAAEVFPVTSTLGLDITLNTSTKPTLTSIKQVCSQGGAYESHSSRCADTSQNKGHAHNHPVKC